MSGTMFLYRNNKVIRKTVFTDFKQSKLIAIQWEKDIHQRYLHIFETDLNDYFISIIYK